MKLKLKDIFPLRTQTCCQPSCAWSKRSMGRALKLWRWRCDVEWRSSRTNIFIHDSLRYFTLADAVELSKKVSSGPCYMWTDISGHPLTDYLASKISANTTCVSTRTAALLRISLSHHQANSILKACSALEQFLLGLYLGSTLFLTHASSVIPISLWWRRRVPSS